jgi:hypothetical protein
VQLQNRFVAQYVVDAEEIRGGVSDGDVNVLAGIHIALA